MTAVPPVPPRAALRIGRADDNDVRLDDLRVSRHHAEIRFGADGGARLVDLGSQNGTFLEGRRIKDAPIDRGQVVGVGGQSLEFDGTTLRVIEERHSGWFGAIDLTVDVDGGRRILDEVGFALEPSSVLGVVGPSGSGKSTFLNALTGFRPADGGRVIFDGRDLYATYEHLRTRMGLVPQADILHTNLTVRQALSYAAELRFPLDVPAETRRARVDAVMAELNLDDRADTRIDRLSGGQRKRVSVASELLTEPSLLFLDEPTSGLDPGNEAVLMGLLRDLARAGRTVVVVTHSVQSLDLCDRVAVLAPGGKLAFFGRPSEALAYFARFGHVAGYADLFRLLEERRDIDWKAAFRADTAYQVDVAGPLGSPDLDAIPARPNIDPPPPPTPVAHQLGVLVRRYLRVIGADRGFALTLALQAPVFGILFALMFGRNMMTTADALNASVLIWLIVLGATWLGTSNAIREIVKELPIYRRERSIGLSTGAYLLSKVLVLGAITVAQAAVLVPIALLHQRLPAVRGPAEGVLFLRFGLTPDQLGADPPTSGAILGSQGLELVLVAVLVGLAALALGLAISAVVGGVDRAATILPILLVAQIIVSAPLFLSAPLPLRVLGSVTSSQWGMSAAASSVGLTDIRRTYQRLLVLQAQKPDRIDTPDKVRGVLAKADVENPAWRHDGGTFASNLLVLLALTALALSLAWAALRRTDPDLMEGRHPRGSPWRRLRDGLRAGAR